MLSGNQTVKAQLCSLAPGIFGELCMLGFDSSELVWPFKFGE